MTIDERFERLEHYTAGLGETFRIEREESRQLWREAQQKFEEQILVVTGNLAELSEQFLRSQKEAEERKREADERKREIDERFRQTGERIDSLVSAIGRWIRHSSAR